MKKWMEGNKYPLTRFMTECSISTMEDGQALWKILANRRIEVNGVLLENGSWRYNGGIISEICGGDYMDYYCNDVDKTHVKKIWKIMKKHGAMDETDYHEYDDNDNCHGFWYYELK